MAARNAVTVHFSSHRILARAWLELSARTRGAEFTAKRDEPQSGRLASQCYYPIYRADMKCSRDRLGQCRTRGEALADLHCGRGYYPKTVWLGRRSSGGYKVSCMHRAVAKSTYDVGGR